MPEPYSIQRYRGVLAVCYHDENGKRHRYSLGTTDRVEAEAAARRIWQGRGDGKQIKTVGDAVELYLASKADMASIKRAQCAWKASRPYWQNLSIERVDEPAVAAYSTFRKHCKPITIRNELAVIRAALNWCAQQKKIDKAPFIKMPALPESTVGHLSMDEFERLYEGARRPHVKLFLELAVGTGARSNAILDLTWDRVDFERNIIILNPRDRVQTSKYRATVPMNDDVRAALLSAKQGALSDYVIEHGRGKVQSIKKGFAEACKRSGIKATPHMLRHSAAVWMAERNVPMGQIAQFLGHSDSRITERVYARFSPQFLQGAASALKWRTRGEQTSKKVQQSLGETL